MFDTEQDTIGFSMPEAVTSTCFWKDETCSMEKEIDGVEGAWSFQIDSLIIGS